MVGRGQTVNICRCEQGEEVTLAYGKGLLSLSGDMADNAKFYTRLYPVGSSATSTRRNTATPGCNCPAA